MVNPHGIGQLMDAPWALAAWNIVNCREHMPCETGVVFDVYGPAGGEPGVTGGAGESDLSHIGTVGLHLSLCRGRTVRTNTHPPTP